MNTTIRPIGFVLAASVLGLGQSTVSIHVDASQTAGAFKPIYGYFGYDEPNYTYSNYGRKLIGELAALARDPVYIRTHFLLATGDGTPALKWGSTNAYTEDASGRPVYDWTIVDRIFDTYLLAGAKPFVEIGFMPRALSSKPDPYQPKWIPGAANRDYSIGWSYPPKNYDKWGELIFHWVTHAVEKYGRPEVASWYWEVWNEPDISYWHGTPEEYDKLYDVTAAAVKRALPTARIGGPASTGPSAAKAGAFLRQFLEHCASTGAPLDFITFHAKGRPTVVDGQVRMGLAKQEADVQTGFEIVGQFPKFRSLPIVISESDPEGCAACSARVYPQNAYRNGAVYPAYTAAMMKTILDLAARDRVNIEGMLTWAFEFENQPYFDGFRTLATNGIDKPVLNFFRMAGLMTGERLELRSDGAPDIDGVAARSDRRIAVMVWNYNDDVTAHAQREMHVTVDGLPAGAGSVLVRHYRVDGEHSNAYTLWKEMGSPQSPSPEQYRRLESAGELALLTSPRWIRRKAGSIELKFDLPQPAVSLIELTW